jgi:hypothetical protein
VQYILAQETIVKFEAFLQNAIWVKTILGKELLSRKYEPIFPYFKDTALLFKFYRVIL